MDEFGRGDVPPRKAAGCEILARVADHSKEHVIRFKDTLRIRRDDAHDIGFVQPAELLLALAQRLFGVLAFGNVASGSRDELHLAIGPEHRRENILVNAKDSGSRRFEGHLTFDWTFCSDDLRNFPHVHVMMPLLVAEFAARLSDDLRKLHAPNVEQPTVRVDEPSLPVEKVDEIGCGRSDTVENAELLLVTRHRFPQVRLHLLLAGDVKAVLNYRAVAKVAPREQHPAARAIGKDVLFLVGTDSPCSRQSPQLFFAGRDPLRRRQPPPRQFAALELAASVAGGFEEYLIGIDNGAGRIEKEDAHGVCFEDPAQPLFTRAARRFCLAPLGNVVRDGERSVYVPRGIAQRRAARLEDAPMGLLFQPKRFTVQSLPVIAFLLGCLRGRQNLADPPPEERLRRQSGGAQCLAFGEQIPEIPVDDECRAAGEIGDQGARAFFALAKGVLGCLSLRDLRGHGAHTQQLPFVRPHREPTLGP